MFSNLFIESTSIPEHDAVICARRPRGHEPRLFMGHVLAGRGRISEGTCYRLYSEADFESRPRYTDPEIRRAALAGVILRMLSLGLGRIEEFPFLEPPDPRAIADGWQQLAELGAVDEQRRLTPIGKLMSS